MFTATPFFQVSIPLYSSAQTAFSILALSKLHLQDIRKCFSKIGEMRHDAEFTTINLKLLTSGSLIILQLQNWSKHKGDFTCDIVSLFCRNNIYKLNVIREDARQAVVSIKADRSLTAASRKQSIAAINANQKSRRKALNPKNKKKMTRCATLPRGSHLALTTTFKGSIAQPSCNC